MKIVASHQLDPAAVDYLKKQGFVLYVANSPNPSSYIDQLKTADAFILRVGVCDSSIIEQCSHLKVIGRTGVGYDNVDVSYATKHGIPVVITPGANSRSVAEHALALMFACAKNMEEADSEIRKGNWLIRDAGKAVELAGRKVGIIGVGAIGKLVAQLCSAIGMECFGYSHSHNRAKVEAAGCAYCENLDDMLSECDVITLHVPLKGNTKHLLGAREISLMKECAMLINTSRGAVVDEKALADALNANRIAAAGIDVVSTEPITMDNPLLHAKNTILTPHSAALTKEALRNMCVECAKGCVAVCKGERWPHIVDPSVYDVQS